ncbi:putative Mn2+ efflux pump MntP [Geomicrobium halophilum]|uniref:Putative Mn2+ efflux pump MntP n=1 Tax=Geomicrobium halophilum TaxID=549000 RepID=A0A841PRN9_9BACL|nr:manganese efflux pump [Geomicrobium halophilum]MBB6450474.1 putative Mn2+ efflux pump MntP [Geomicrobium halophilum]
MSEWLSTTVMATVLGMDAFSVAMAFGLQTLRIHILKIAITVGLFHMLMPLLGISLGFWMTSMYNAEIAQVVAGLILLVIGIQMINSSRKAEKGTSFHLHGMGLFLFAFIVSLDSFSIGVSLGIFGVEVIMVIIVFGVMSTFLTWLGLRAATLLRHKIGSIGEGFGGLILMLFGLNTLRPMLYTLGLG